VNNVKERFHLSDSGSFGTQCVVSSWTGHILVSMPAVGSLADHRVWHSQWWPVGKQCPLHEDTLGHIMLTHLMEYYDFYNLAMSFCVLH
jgi:hypothetical protein